MRERQEQAHDAYVELEADLDARRTRDPKRVDLRRILMRTLVNHGMLLRRELELPAEAEVVLRRSAELARGLLIELPQDVEMRSGLAFALDELSQTLPPERSEETSALLAEAEAIFAALASSTTLEHRVATERLAGIRERRAKLRSGDH
jgi:hypothetical protein